MWREILLAGQHPELGLHGNPKLLPEHTIASMKHGGGKVPYVDV